MTNGYGFIMGRNVACVALLLALAACKTVPNEYGAGDPVKPLTTEERVQMAVRNAAVEARQGKIVSGALRDSEQAYKSAPNNGAVALRYAQDLRKAGLVEQAQMVLRPFAIDPEKSAADILVEYAKIKLESGDFEGAQIHAQEAMVLNENYAAVYHVLGIAVDAQGHHQAAENHFRKALAMLSKDDPLHAAATNNLALSLIAQGKTGEADSLLSSAGLAITPEQDVVKANRALVNSL